MKLQNKKESRIKKALKPISPFVFGLNFVTLRNSG